MEIVFIGVLLFLDQGLISDASELDSGFVVVRINEALRGHMSVKDVLRVKIVQTFKDLIYDIFCLFFRVFPGMKDIFKNVSSSKILVDYNSLIIYHEIVFYLGKRLR